MKMNHVLIGVIVALIGLFSLVRNFFAFDFSLVTLVIGLALILLYRQKKPVWALFLGGYLAFAGVTHILSNMGLGLNGRLMFAAMFFIVPGIIFMLLYFDKNKRGLLIPSCVMLWLGGYFVLLSYLRPGIRLSFGLLLVFLGFSFCTAYLVGRSHLSRGVLHVGVFLAAIGGLMFVGLINLAGGLPRLASYVLIVIGAVIVVKSVRGKS